MTYIPKPIDTSNIKLTHQILELTERLSDNAHDIWARQRITDGWKYGAKRDDTKKEHPCLIPYVELPESEKEYDRSMVMQTLKAIVVLGYRIEKV